MAGLQCRAWTARVTFMGYMPNTRFAASQVKQQQHNHECVSHGACEIKQLLNPTALMLHQNKARVGIEPGCELIIVKATDSVPNSHFSSAFWIVLSCSWLLLQLAPPLAQQGLVGCVSTMCGTIPFWAPHQLFLSYYTLHTTSACYASLNSRTLHANDSLGNLANWDHSPPAIYSLASGLQAMACTHEAVAIVLSRAHTTKGGENVKPREDL
ncbi:hypothetical protein HaLaN_13243 [Haematococcus lacustris]|uniref:Uncharacterized protein n=1 Tax=Haematococcus lacustris TaxID=44745 RepID=A0A699ZC30_HAELA|nr:hypothetical protein HaLaN_13243 [Haematococcus lacustris]